MIEEIKRGIALYNQNKFIEAYDIFVKYKESDNQDVLYYLGLIYYYGHGVKKNYDKSFQYFSYLALHKYTNAYYYLGYFYEKGIGVPKNITQAKLWYNYAVKNHHVKALYRLGKLNSNNLELAYLFLDEAISLNHLKSILYKASLVDNVNEKLLLYQKAAVLGSLEGMLEACKVAYDNNINFDDFISYIEALYNNKEQEIYEIYAKCLLEGKYFSSNKEKGIKILKEGSLLGISKCREILGDIYYEGNIVKKDIFKAIKYYLEAIKDNNKNAYIKLIKIYYYEPLYKNDNIVFEYIKRLADLGEVSYIRFLAKSYEIGFGTNINLDLSYYYYEKASKLNDQYSKDKLNDFYLNINNKYKLRGKKNV